MQSGPSSKRGACLRYSAAPVFDRADPGARVITQLCRGDVFILLSSEGQFCQVQLANGATGFVYGNNISVAEPPQASAATAQQPRDGANLADGEEASLPRTDSRRRRGRVGTARPRNG